MKIAMIEGIRALIYMREKIALDSRELFISPQVQEQYFYAALTTAEKTEIANVIGVREINRKRLKLKTFYVQFHPLSGCVNKTDIKK